MTRKWLSTLLALSVALPSIVSAAPGRDPGPAPGRGPDRPGPSAPAPKHNPGHRMSVLPDLATALVVGGLTYYLVNGLYYQKQGVEYIQVETPSGVSSALNVVDFNGKRYYVRDGHYYQRDINGSYTEVPRPAGL
ncbi:DUF6515 family protein [Entomohabitans teleogrylli]|uniref:DUF6515 family protein n=1 Tax=Entomohabitans teleogrylli TaxID=1384589 RepID=UPI00073D36AE|nr:DUF6515 family protein [Entomohabitans teleogrylli]